MLFKPDHKYEIIPEKEFTDKIEKISKALENYENSGSINAKNNCVIRYKYYEAENAAATVVILHGFTEFMKKYEENIWYFLNMGCNVFIYDQRGHGISGREVNDISLAHINDFFDYVSDLEQIMNEVVLPRFKSLPIWLYTHSMGGAVAMLYLQKHGDTIQKAVLSSPLVFPQTSNIPAFLVRKSLKKYAKEDGWNARFRQAKDKNPNPSSQVLSDPTLSLSRFRRTLFFHIYDKNYQNNYPTNSWVMESMSVKNQILNRKLDSKIKTNVLIISAENDKVVKLNPQHQLAKRLKNCRLVTIKNANHTIFTCSNPIIEEYYKYIFNFLNI